MPRVAKIKIAPKKNKTVKKTATLKVVKPATKKLKNQKVTKAVQKLPKTVVVNADVVIKKEESQLVKGKSLKADVVGTDGKKVGSISLPPELFATEVKQILLAQAVRVYLANQREGSASVKTRGEVEGSTKKVYRQKGTGKARHGSIRAPIYVGGGIVFGPEPRDFSLKFSKKMRNLAMRGSLTAQYNSKNIILIDGLEKLETKTKVMAHAIDAISGSADSLLLVIPKEDISTIRAARNIAKVDIIQPDNINTYAILSHRKVLITRKAIEILTQTYIRN
jgi:large subunit ribosomal protein L4